MFDLWSLAEIKAFTALALWASASNLVAATAINMTVTLHLKHIAAEAQHQAECCIASMQPDVVTLATVEYKKHIVFSLLTWLRMLTR